jgi:hypothetical protein
VSGIVVVFTTCTCTCIPPGGIPAAPLAASFCPQPVISGTDTLKYKTANARSRGAANTGVSLSNEKLMFS